ncbi:hypothetical protein SAMN05421690_10154 [Nitrosomonas sp. Nm51]|uniref:hypothetical protein n=1 Tax=Nitrosomonas sp. Nm51 TaxID=133720 RepID=UPI0008B3A1CC|nr:hypothetical protein [Nitrosomonas sp. Nm51]SER25823.1 hypothetical protein SAMN05421690_10154 [Nitrosomonas sp. Nm51]
MKTSRMFLLTTIVLPLLSACATPSQIMADAEVRRLCEKDGGIRVYETVTLPVERFNKYGQILVPAKRLAKPEDKFYYESFQNYFRKGNPDIYQLHTKVYRKTDSKLLGESISYVRRGGDMPGPWHPSSFSCPEEAGLNNLNKQIFIKE